MKHAIETTMKYQTDDVSGIHIINNPSLTHEDFSVNGQNYDSETIYTCHQGHRGAIPNILPYVSSYSTGSAKVSITGIIVFICPACGMPVRKYDEQKTSYYAESAG